MHGRKVSRRWVANDSYIKIANDANGRILTTENTENTESCCFLCVLCALCGFLIPFQKIIESLVNSCHSQIREICVKNVSEYTIEIQSVSRMTRLNESYEFNYVSMPEAMS
jgi:L-lactate utilization protein LutB